MMTMCRSVVALATLILLGIPMPANAQAVRSGLTFSTGGTPLVTLPDVAYDSLRDRYLVVAEGAGHTVIEGKLVSAAGAIIGSFVISGAPPAGSIQMPRVAFGADVNGGAGGFLVSWHEQPTGGLFTQVKARLISADGAGLSPVFLISTEAVSVTSSTCWIMAPPVAYSTVSQEFLVAWMGSYNVTNDIRFTRVDLTGTLLQPSPTTITAGTKDWERDPTVAYNQDDDEFFIGYAGFRDALGYSYVTGRRVKAGTGAVVSAPVEYTQTAVTYVPAVTYNLVTKQYLISWYNRTSAFASIYGINVNADGSAGGALTVLSNRYFAYDANDLKYNPFSGDYLVVTHGNFPESWEDAAVSIKSDGTPYDNGFFVTRTTDVRPLALDPAKTDGNFYPRIAASAAESKWLLVTASLFKSINGQLVASLSTTGPQVPPPPPPPPGPSLTPDRTSLAFGVIGGAPQSRTSPQSIRLAQSGPAATITWTASTSAAWLQVSPASGTGAGELKVSLVPDALPAASTSASITIATTIAETGATKFVAPISVSLTVHNALASKPPFGSVDSPVNNLTGVTGSMAITGWAVDDVDVARVRIVRDPTLSEGPGQVYVGDAMMVEGARPDVASLFPAYPQSARAGWGYLLLTNMLPALGNGTFKFYAYADDVDGHSTLLGTRTVTCANSGATQPFGTVDTPAPGETVAGSVYTSYGWVLAHGTRRADVPGGGTVTVFIDGTPVGSPIGWTGRADLQAVFPSLDYSGVSFALGAFDFDTTTLSNGMHTISWNVTDNEGNAAGVGSRFFRVFNGGSSQMASVKGAGSLIVARDAAGAVADTGAIEARRGYALGVPFLKYEADTAGRVTLHSEELDRIELQTHGATDGYLVTSAGLRPLPIGSRLDPSTGVFVWQPGVGFIGSYDLAFLRHAGGRLVRQDVRIVLDPKGSNRIGPQIVVDLVGQVVAGWAADLDSQVDRGIDLIHVWAYPAAGGHPVFVGEASYGGERPDVAAIYGERFHATGYGIRVQGLEPGTYDLAIFAWSSAKHGWLPAKVVRIVVPAL